MAPYTMKKIRRQKRNSFMHENDTRPYITAEVEKRNI